MISVEVRILNGYDTFFKVRDKNRKKSGIKTQEAKIPQ